MTSTQMKKPFKIVDFEGSKRLIVVNAENVNVVQAKKHHKANTQNVNIYNIIHNESHAHHNDATEQLSSYNTIDGSNLIRDRYGGLNKSKPINLHELALKEELQLYKAEVEHRFSKSSVNRNYIFPRLVEGNDDRIDDIEIESRNITLETANTKKGTNIFISLLIEAPTILISIYDAENRDIANFPTDKKSVSLFKEGKQTRNRKILINTDLFKRIKKVLHVEGGSKERDRDDVSAKMNNMGETLTVDTLNNTNGISPYSKQKLNNSALEDYTKPYSDYNLKGIIGKPRYNAKNKNQRILNESVVIVSTNNTGKNGSSNRTGTSSELPALMSLDSTGGNKEIKGMHMRNYTNENNSDSLGGGRTLALKKAVVGIKAGNGKSRSKVQVLQSSEYFHTLLSKNPKPPIVSHIRADTSNNILNGTTLKMVRKDELRKTQKCKRELNVSACGMISGGKARNTSQEQHNRSHCTSYFQ